MREAGGHPNFKKQEDVMTQDKNSNQDATGAGLIGMHGDGYWITCYQHKIDRESTRGPLNLYRKDWEQVFHSILRSRSFWVGGKSGSP